MTYNPAKELEHLSNRINLLTCEIASLKMDGGCIFIQEQELKKLNAKFNTEFERVHNEYCELFQDCYFTTSDIQNMLDLDIQMINKRMSREVEHIQFSHIMRRYVKSCRRLKENDKLEFLLYQKSIDIDKKIFFSRKSLIEWLVNHVTTYNKIPITKSLAINMIDDRSTTTVLSTVSFKEKHCIKYDMQLQRLKRERLFFYMDYSNSRVLSRIPVNPQWDAEICRIRELS